MKTFRLILLSLATLLGFNMAQAAEQANYTVDFDTAIPASEHDFQVASNWGHIVDKYTDYGVDYWMTYTYLPTGGKDDTGGLKAGKQFAGDDSGWGTDGINTKDILVTPPVKGTISIEVKPATYASSAKVYFYNINADGSLGSVIQQFTGYSGGAISSSGWSTLTINATEYKKIGIWAEQVVMDNFSASFAEIEPERNMRILTGNPSQTTGTIKWNQSPDGSVKVEFTDVTVQNIGEVNLNQGEEDFSVSIINSNTGEVFCTVPVPQNLTSSDQAISEPFTVTATIAEDKVKTLWPNSYTYAKMCLKENIKGKVSPRAQSHYNAYEALLVFRDKGNNTNYSISSAQAFGNVSESTSKTYEILNNGIAPMEVTTLTAPEGFTLDVQAPFTVAPKEIKEITVTLPATEFGNYNDKLTLVYNVRPAVAGQDPSTKTYTLGFNGAVIDPNAWFADFNGESKVAYPQGSVAQSGVNASYNGTENNLRNYYLTGSQYNNLFISPKLRAKAGDKISFAARVDGYSKDDAAYVKVYVSSDRYNWPEEPAFTVSGSEITTEFLPHQFALTEAGDIYVAFAIYKSRFDNVSGPQKVDVPHDVYICSFTQNNDEIQTGRQINPQFVMIPLTEEPSTGYTVELIANGEAVATPPDNQKVALYAESKKEYNYTFEWTPEVENTTDYELKVRVTIGDQTFETDSKPLRVLCEPIFAFFNKGTSVNEWNRPDSRKTAIDFGRVNTANATQEFEIYNWGKKPLNVKSVTVPTGFASSLNDTIAQPAERIPLNLSVTATEPGNYGGDLTITYENAQGADTVFTLPVSVTMLDHTKWYAPFHENGTLKWPEGSLHQSNMSISNLGTTTEPNFFLSGSGGTSDPSKNMFITPKLHANADETLEFAAKLRASGWPEGCVTIFAAPTREELTNAEEGTQRVEILALKGKDFEDGKQLTADLTKFNVKMPAEGNYYIGVQIVGSAQVNYLYGFSLVEVDHDLQYVESTIPAEAMQNTSVKASMKVRNFGTHAETAETYKMNVYIDGQKEFELAGPAEIACATTPTDTPVEIPVSFHYNKIGEFPVVIELEAGETILRSDTVAVNFTKETIKSDVTVGEYKEYSTTGFININYKQSQNVTLYTPAELGLDAGAKIKKIVIKGYGTNEWTTDFKIYYRWSDATSMDMPATEAFNTDGWINILDNAAYKWEKIGSSSDPVDYIVINLDEPIVYESGKSLELFTFSYCENYKSTFGFECASNGTSYMRQKDGDISTQSWKKNLAPVLHLGLEVEPVTVSGVVTEAGQPAEGAEVTLLSTDGNKVGYAATTDAEGKYEIDVIQNAREYNLLVLKAGKEDFADAMTFAESDTVDLQLRTVVFVDESGAAPADCDDALVKFNLPMETGHNVVALPFSLSPEEVAEIFGEGTTLHNFGKTDIYDADSDSPRLHLILGDVAATDSLRAGVPYLIDVKEATTPLKIRGIKTIAEPSKVDTWYAEIVPVFAATTLPEKAFTLKKENFMDQVEEPTPTPDAAAQADEAGVKAYSAYVQVKPQFNAATLTYEINDVKSAIESVASELDENVVIYDLNGFRVKNPTEGIYIVNGRKVLIRR